MPGPAGSSEKAVIIFEDGLKGDRELSSAVEATLRHATQAFRVVVAPNRTALDECLAASEPVLLIVDADRCPAAEFERLVASFHAAAATRHLPVLAMVTPQNLPAVQEALRLSPVDFILKPFDPDELWGRVRVCLHHAASLAELQRANDELARKSATDSLTGLFNLSSIIERCEQEISRAKRYNLPVSCLLIDVDSFKTVNDTYGHPVGNEVLRELAGLLRSSVRGSDTIGRFGGEEFLIVLPQTDRDGAVVLAERLRRAVEINRFKVGRWDVGVTVSVGVATFPGEGVVGRETLFLAVDHAVYLAKSLGRNRVACLPDAEGSPGEEDARGEENSVVEEARMGARAARGRDGALRAIGPARRAGKRG